MPLETPLHAAHLAAGGKMVEFAGWELPIHYGSQMEEHSAVRSSAGMFDVSHMGTVDFRGPQAREFLQRVLANDIDRAAEQGQAIYSCMLNDQGGVIDDLITFRVDNDFYRGVLNAARREVDLEWLRRHAEGFDVEITEREDLAIIAVQGPEAGAKLGSVLGGDGAAVVEALKPFRAASHGDFYIARTGYTGEDGFEVMLPGDHAVELWDQLVAAGVRPCGLGARDSLRLEAGLNLYGQDMDESTTPLISNLGWTVAFTPEDRDFIGRKALEQQKAQGVAQQLVGLVFGRGGIPRAGAVVNTSEGPGVITSGVFGPTVKGPVALARVPAGNFEEVEVELRGRSLAARVVSLPFVRHGKVRV